MLVPRVLEHYLNPQAGRSYTLLSNVAGEDLNNAWENLNKGQQTDVLEQVAEHVQTLAKLTSDRLPNAEEGMVWEPCLCSRYLGDPKIPRHPAFGLLYPEKSKEWEVIWGARQNELVFYHAELGPENIKVEVQMERVKVVGILDWEIAGYMPKG